MTRRCRTSPPPLPSSARRSRRSIHDEDLDDNLGTILDNYNDSRDHNSKSDNKPLRQPSWKVMGKQPPNYSFKSTLGGRVVATQLPISSALPLHRERQEVNIVSEEEDERVPAPLASKMVSDYMFQ